MIPALPSSNIHAQQLLVPINAIETYARTTNVTEPLVLQLVPPKKHKKSKTDEAEDKLTMESIQETKRQRVHATENELQGEPVFVAWLVPDDVMLFNQLFWDGRDCISGCYKMQV